MKIMRRLQPRLPNAGENDRSRHAVIAAAAGRSNHRARSYFAWRGSTPGQIVVAQWKVPIALAGDLEDRVGNG